MAKTKSIMDLVKSYEDACKLEKLIPLKLSDFDFLPEKDRAYHFHDHRSVIIKRALNKGWEANHADRNQIKYTVWYIMNCDAGSARGFSYVDYDGDRGASGVGARHEFKSLELAKYFAKQFIDEVNACFIIKNSN